MGSKKLRNQPKPGQIVYVMEYNRTFSKGKRYECIANDEYVWMSNSLTRQTFIFVNKPKEFRLRADYVSQTDGIYRYVGDLVFPKGYKLIGRRAKDRQQAYTDRLNFQRRRDDRKNKLRELKSKQKWELSDLHYHLERLAKKDLSFQKLLINPPLKRELTTIEVIDASLRMFGVGGIYETMDMFIDMNEEVSKMLTKEEE